MYRTVPFVARGKIIKEVLEQISRLQADAPVLEAIWVFSGIAYVGKTTLLRQLRRRTTEGGLPNAYIDFDVREGGDRYTDDPGGKIALLQDIMDGLSEVGDLIPPRLPMSSDNVEHAELEFERYIRRLLDYRLLPLILYVDTLEQASPDLVGWLEVAVLLPLLETERAFIIVASRRHHDWKEPDVRRRVKVIDLPPFNPDETREQLAGLAGTPATFVSNNVFQLTGGLPGANTEVVEQVQNLDLQWEQVFKPESGSYLHLLRYLVETFLLQEVPTPPIPDDIRDVLRVIAPLRHIDYAVLPRVLSAVLPDLQPRDVNPLVWLRKLVHRLQESTLVEWSAAHRGYVLHRTARHTLCLYQKRLRPDQFYRVHQVAAGWYGQMVQEYGPTYLVDRIYHLSFAQDDPSSQIQEDDLESQMRDEIDGGIRRLGDMTPEEALRDADQIRNELRVSEKDIFAPPSGRYLKLLEEKITDYAKLGEPTACDTAKVILSLSKGDFCGPRLEKPARNRPSTGLYTEGAPYQHE